MMTIAETAFHAWAPSNGRWSNWAKPVTFAHLNRFLDSSAGGDSSIALASAGVDMARVPDATGSTLIIVDLPGKASVQTGLNLAGTGYRPVPLYNSVPAPERSFPARSSAAMINMDPILAGLVEGVPKLEALQLLPDSPPAFLLDSRRRFGDPVPLVPGVFDNRSISLPTDFPSGHLLVSCGFVSVVVILDTAGLPQIDLAHTLRRWQEVGLGIFLLHANMSGSPQSVTIPPPPRFRHLWYGLLARLGLRRNPLGGYGGLIPIPSAG